MQTDPSGPAAENPNAFAFRFTPAEWRQVLEDRSFLTDQDNRYLPPRRLMGVEVVIVPDHQFGAGLAEGRPNP